IRFTTSFQGEGITGGFSQYTAQIAFDPPQLGTSHVKVTIDLTSVNSGDGDRDSTLKGGDFFNTAATPKAVFEARSFTKKDATHFVAHGRLTLRGVTKPCELPFTLTIRNGVADMSGTATVDRTAYGVGGGEFAATDTLPAQVKVTIKLKAKAQP
ncbi:MAG: YceI family protein, partial [Asticcacaulis sp.]|nr:YceI family protein [Asticcacaulis sp.]